MSRKKSYNKQLTDDSENILSSDNISDYESDDNKNSPDNETGDDSDAYPENSDNKNFSDVDEYDDDDNLITGENEKDNHMTDINTDYAEEMSDAEPIGDDEQLNIKSKICHVKNLNEEVFVLDDDDSKFYEKMKYKKIAPENRISDPVMTLYEMVRIIGTRAQQINFGAKPLIMGMDDMHPAKIAYVELMEKMTPFIIRRHLPGKKYEEWRVDELEIIHQITDDFFVPDHYKIDT